MKVLNSAYFPVLVMVLLLSYTLANNTMLRSFLSVAIRNLLRQSLFTGINIFGLSVGLAVASLVVLYTSHELAYDAFHSRHGNIIRISEKRGGTWFASLEIGRSNALYENQLPEVEKVVRLRRFPPKYLSYKSDKFYERKVLITDPGSAFFELFQFPLISGDPKLALKEPHSAVLTESIAMKMFGKNNPLGEAILFDTLEVRVTAVIKDLPSNTHMDFSVLITNNRAMALASGHMTYCLLSPHADTNTFKEKILSAKVKDGDASQDIRIIPLRDLHFDGNLTFEMKPAGSKLYLYVFVAIGVMIILLSCFNFINLSIAVYTNRAKEIAVRKVVGASRGSISRQFIFESVCLSLICLPVTLAILELTLPAFNSFMGVRLVNVFIESGIGILGFLGLTMGIGLLSACYPALIVPRVSSLVLFKRGLIHGIGGMQVRSGLVGFQMIIMVLMLSGSWVIHDQLNYLTQKDLGFEHENVLKLKGAGMVDSVQFAALKTKLLSNPSIVTVSHGIVPGDEDYGMSYRLEGSELVTSDLIAFGTDKAYLKTLGIEVIGLENKSLDEGIPERVVLVNSTMAKRLGPEPIGQRIVLHPGKPYERTRTVDGIFRDFHFFSLHQPIAPMMLTLVPTVKGVNENILVKIRTSHVPETMDFITAASREFVPTIPLTLEFLDEAIYRQYEKEKKLSFFCFVLLGITVLLSILGLVGLASYTTELRTKEVGIRKVLGASLENLLVILSAPYLKMAFVALIVGGTLSFLATGKWLEKFVYRIDVNWFPYLFTMACLLFVLAITIGWYAFRASRANPIHALRSE